MWSVYKIARSCRVEHLVDLPEQEALDHAALLNKRFAPEFIYWAQRPKEAP